MASSYSHIGPNSIKPGLCSRFMPCTVDATNRASNPFLIRAAPFEGYGVVVYFCIIKLCSIFRVPFWGSVNPSPLGDGMRSIRCDANGKVGKSHDMGL